ncbi:Uncharacterised protein [Chlamydia trachomatis]|nr:Uncharacterised protein [Chlamydia trachomatis]
MGADDIGEGDDIIKWREMRERPGGRCKAGEGGEGLDREYVELSTRGIRVLDELATTHFTDDL